MNHCPSCGGVLGRDCFNAAECAAITASMNSCEDYELLRQIDVLKACLIENGIPIPDLTPKPSEPFNIEDLF